MALLLAIWHNLNFAGNELEFGVVTSIFTVEGLDLGQVY